MSLEKADDPLDLFPGNVAADTRLEERLAVRRAGAEDDRVSDEDPGQAHEDHCR